MNIQKDDLYLMRDAIYFRLLDADNFHKSCVSSAFHDDSILLSFRELVKLRRLRKKVISWQDEIIRQELSGEVCL